MSVSGDTAAKEVIARLNTLWTQYTGKMKPGQLFDMASLQCTDRAAFTELLHRATSLSDLSAQVVEKLCDRTKQSGVHVVQVSDDDLVDILEELAKREL